jgi:hypothetical protein
MDTVVIVSINQGLMYLEVWDIGCSQKKLHDENFGLKKGSNHIGMVCTRTIKVSALSWYCTME